MAPRLDRVAAIVSVLLVGFLELLFFDHGALNSLLGVVAVAAAGVALHAECFARRLPAGRSRSTRSRSTRPRPAGSPMPPSRAAATEPDRVPQPRPGPAVTFPVAGPHAAPAAVATMTRTREEVAAFPAPPLFGARPSRANALPWLLPAHAGPTGVAADEARLGELTVRAASVLGPGHRCEEPAGARQDAYALGRDATGRYLIVAVADGLASSRRSELGASTGATAAVELLAAALSAGSDLGALDAGELFRQTAARMAGEAARHGVGARDTCAVLITAVVDTLLTGDARDCWLAWVGDVSAWQLLGERWEPFAGDIKQDAGGIASNVVAACLPLQPDHVAQRSFRQPPGATFALVTDGIGDAWAMMSEANAYFAQRWADPPPVGAYLNDVGYDARGFQDDRTAVTVWTDGPVEP